LENAFADLSTQTNAEFFERESFEKPKRNAFVFITAEPDSSQIALEDLKHIGEVKEVYLSYGTYDIVAKVSGESLEHLREIVSKQIKNLSSIRSALTLMVI
jgi:DNA-binding Lrp family transcriptional regulator